MARDLDTDVTYLALDGPDKKVLEDLSCLITVSDVFESLGCLLSSNVEQNLLTTSAKRCQKTAINLSRTKCMSIRGECDTYPDTCHPSRKWVWYIVLLQMSKNFRLLANMLAHTQVQSAPCICLPYCITMS